MRKRKTIVLPGWGGVHLDKLLSVVIVVFAVTLSIGYSAFNTSLNITGIVSKVRVQKDIRITGLSYSSSGIIASSGGVSTYEEYSTNSLLLGVKLPNRSSKVTYKVTVTNFGNTEMGIFSIDNLPSGLSYSISEYNLKDKICDDSGECTLGITKDFYLSIGYSVSGYNSDITEYDLKLNVDFRQMHSVTYAITNNNNYPSSVIDGGTLNVTFTDPIPSRLKLTMDGSDLSTDSYTYTDGSLTIPNVTGNVIVSEQYTISYNANNGSGAPSSQTKTHGTNLTLSSIQPSRTGYTFQGWGTSSGATSAAYQPGSTYTANSGTTLYAIWKVNTYTITYHANGGSGAPSSQSYTYDANNYINLSSQTPSRSGYTFLGWSLSSNATSASYSPGQAWYRYNISNYTLYAVWRINTYTVSYHANGGSGAPSAQTKTHGVNLTLSSTKPTRSGYNFQGWGTSSGATTVSYNPGGTYTSNSSITLYAIWKSAYSDTWVDTGSSGTLTYGYSESSRSPGWMQINVQVTWKEQFNAYKNASRILITGMKMNSPEWTTNFYLGGAKGVTNRGIYVNGSIVQSMNYYQGTHGCYAGSSYVTVNPEGSSKAYPWTSGEIARGSGGSASIPIRLYLRVTNSAVDHYADFDVTKNVTITGKR